MPLRIRWFIAVSLLNLAVTWVIAAVFHSDFEALAIANFPITHPTTRPDEIIAIAYFSLGLSCLPTIVFTILVACRRGWSRWLFAAFTLYIDGKCLWCMFQPHLNLPSQTAMTILGIVLDFVALVLVFTPSSTAWFRNRRRSFQP